MSDTKFTPGPWYPVNYGGFINLQSEDTYGYSNLLDQESNENAEANSRLAAAAPDMYNLLLEFEKYCEDFYLPDTARRINEIINSINK